MNNQTNLLLNMQNVQRDQTARLTTIQAGLQTLSRTRLKTPVGRLPAVDTTIAILREELSRMVQAQLDLTSVVEQRFDTFDKRLKVLEREPKSPRKMRSKPFNPVRNHIVRTARRNAITRNIDYPDYFHLMYDWVEIETGYDLRAEKRDGENGLDAAERLGILPVVLRAARVCCAATIHGSN